MRVLCPAKLNLVLAVLGKRPDGFHELDTVMCRVDLCDELELAPAEDGISLEVAGPADVPRDESNLAWAAAKAYLRIARSPAGLAIRLRKRIPAGAGLGGGSSDAAGVLAGCRELLGPLPVGREDELALRLGSDVPFFLDAQAARARGRGEFLESVRAKGEWSWVLVFPGVSCSTARVYAEWRPEDGRPRDVTGLVRALEAGDPAAAGACLGNDLHAPCARLYPRVAEAARALERLGWPASLSGSGSTLFALAPDPQVADRAAERLRGEGWDALAVRFSPAPTGKDRYSG